MNKYSASIRWAGALFALWLLISSCGLLNRTTRVGETRTETKTIELRSANEVQVQIKMGAGQLSVAGNADSLMDATFRYNVANWKPRVNYIVNSSKGELVVDHTDDNLPIGGQVVNEWNLSLNNLVPMDLEVETGAGETDLDLRGLALTNLDVQIGAGNVNIDLSDALDHDLSVAIRGGVGKLSVKLPDEMGVRVSVSTGIGGLTNSGLVKDGDYYVNDVYGSSPNTLFLDIETGIGSINMRTQ